MTEERLLEIVKQATFIYLGLKGKAGEMVYLLVTADCVISRVGEIVGHGLRVEFGKGVLDDTLYIESF